MPTLDEARQEVGRLSQGLGFVAVSDADSASVATADTWQDGAWLADATRGGQFYVRSYLLRTVEGLADSVRVRRAQAFDPTLGKLTITPHWGDVPAAEEPYEAGWKWHPLTVEAAIRRVHGRMYAPVEVPIDAVGSQLQYGLTDAAAWLQYAAQAERVVARVGADGQRVSTLLDGALLRQVATNGVQALLVDLTDGPLRTDDTLNVRAWMPYQALTPLTDGPSTTIAPLAWLAWEAIWDLLQLPQMNLDDELRQRAAREVRQLRKGSAPPPQGPLFRDPEGSWGAAGAGRY
jgi:hypothetical protein